MGLISKFKKVRLVYFSFVFVRSGVKFIQDTNFAKFYSYLYLFVLCKAKNKLANNS